MSNFREAYQLTMRIEGGYANDPNDRGGETYKGVARNMHPSWSGWTLIDSAKKRPGFPQSLKVDTELEKHVLAFYKDQFWNKINLDKVNSQQIANELFDTGVNCGAGVAAVFLQRALNVTNRRGRDYPDLELDGIIGTKTIEALNNHKRQSEVLKVLNILQGGKYIGIAESNPSQELFMSSWLSRVSL